MATVGVLDQLKQSMADAYAAEDALYAEREAKTRALYLALIAESEATSAKTIADFQAATDTINAIRAGLEREAITPAEVRSELARLAGAKGAAC